MYKEASGALSKLASGLAKVFAIMHAEFIEISGVTIMLYFDCNQFTHSLNLVLACMIMFSVSRPAPVFRRYNKVEARFQSFTHNYNLHHSKAYKL